MNGPDLIEQALRLDARERADMARRLLESLDELSADELDGVWSEEARRRDAAIDQGRLASRPAGQIISGIKARLAQIQDASA